MPRVVDYDERRAELAGAAARLIARSGIGAATMREVAAEAGWTTGALTHYFADKRDLLLCTFQASLGRRRSAQAQRDRTDPRARLVAALEGALPLDEDRRRHWMVTVAFCAHAAGDPALTAAQRDAYRDFLAHITGLVRESGMADADAAVAVAERLIATADGIAVQALFDPDHWPPAHQLELLHRAITWPQSAADLASAP